MSSRKRRVRIRLVALDPNDRALLLEGVSTRLTPSFIHAARTLEERRKSTVHQVSDEVLETQARARIERRLRAKALSQGEPGEFQQSHTHQAAVLATHLRRPEFAGIQLISSNVVRRTVEPEG